MHMTPLYWLIFLGTFAMGGIASLLVRSAYKKYSQVPASSGLTGEEAARRILAQAGLQSVPVVECAGTLTDHYDPTNRTLVLSSDNFHGTSVAAIGIAAHEAGHALQHQAFYAPLQWRMAAVGITSAAGMIIPIVGMVGFWFMPKFALLIMTVAMGIVMAFQLVTLPVEFDATARAKRVVGTLGLVAPGAETAGMNRVLNAAALTYVAAFLSALAQFLYYALQMLNRRD